MSRKLNVLIMGVLLIFVVTVAYAPNDVTPTKGEDIEGRLMKIEKKLDELIKATEGLKEKLDGMDKKQDQIEALIKSRV